MLPILALLLQVSAHPNVCYEVFVRSFYDSNGDGIGDLRGLTQKLDYIAGLGADCVWLMPVAESPSYHGYDVTDYYKVEPDYGTNDDFKAFVTAAHQHKIRVLVDLVLNHTSSEHPWFQEALRDTTAPHRGWYRWSKTPGNNWHKSPVRDEYYFGLFWSGMPDLNYENPAVLEEMKRVARFWLDSMHVDGFRLDAVRHLVEAGNEVSNTPGTHAVLRDFGQYVRGIAPQSYTIGEVWDNTDVILTYHIRSVDGGSADRQTGRFAPDCGAVSARRAGVALGAVPTQSRSDAHDDRARQRHRRRQDRGNDSPHAAGRTLHLLRRGDRDDRRQAGRALAYPNAMDRDLRGLHERQAVGGGAGRFSDHQCGAGESRLRLAAEFLSPPAA